MSKLGDALEALRPQMAAAAQRVLDAWHPDEDGYDEEYGGGGACDDVNSAIQDVIYGIEGVEVVDGGHDGDDHAWTIVYDDSDAFAVNIPPGVYEEGGGYSWRKKDGVTVSPDDVVISPVRRRDVVGAFVGLRGVDFASIASRLASVNVEAARRKTRSRKKSRSKSALAKPTEWACRAELSVEVDFEGDTAKAALVRKLKTEIAAMVESAVKITARDLKLKPSDVRIRVSSLDCVTTPDEPSRDDGGDHDFDD